MISQYIPSTLLASDSVEDRLSVDLTNDEFGAAETQALIHVDGIVGGAASPSGATIASATLVVWTVSASDGTVTIGALDRAFDGSSTWNSMGGGAQTVSTLDSDSSLPDNSYASFDVTSSVQSVVNGGNNYGWAFKIDSEDGWDFCSELPDCDGDMDVSDALKPRLMVVLRPAVQMAEPATPVPTLSTGAILLLLTVIVLAGFGVLRRRMSG